MVVGIIMYKDNLWNNTQERIGKTCTSIQVGAVKLDYFIYDIQWSFYDMILDV